MGNDNTYLHVLHQRAQRHMEERVRYMTNHKNYARAEPPCSIIESLIVYIESKKKGISRISSMYHQDILERIFGELFAFWTGLFKPKPKAPLNSALGGRKSETSIYAAHVGKIKFPAYTGVQVNMMPFQFNCWYSHNADDEVLPENVRQYMPAILSLPIPRSAWEQVHYLTVWETEVAEDGASQRRGGVHCETPGRIVIRTESPDDESGRALMQDHFILTVAWGRGSAISGHDRPVELQGGIYMASNVSDSCRVWNRHVEDISMIPAGGNLAGIESVVGPGETLRKNEVIWMTDRTPHESLPLPKGTRRQFFRVVCPDVNVWYAAHSTPNPHCTLPDHVHVIEESKFTDDGSVKASLTVKDHRHDDTGDETRLLTKLEQKFKRLTQRS